MKNLDPKVKELIKTVRQLINEIEFQTRSKPNRPSIDFNAFDVAGFAGQESDGTSEPIMKMEDEF